MGLVADGQGEPLLRNAAARQHGTDPPMRCWEPERVDWTPALLPP